MGRKKRCKFCTSVKHDSCDCTCMVDECSKGESCKKWCMVRMSKKLQKVVKNLHKASCFEEMESALDKLDDLEYELEKACEWLVDHKGDKRKSCSSRKKVLMLQKAKRKEKRRRSRSVIYC